MTRLVAQSGSLMLSLLAGVLCFTPSFAAAAEPERPRGIPAIVYDASLAPITGTVTAVSGRTATLLVDGGERMVENAVAIVMPDITEDNAADPNSAMISLDLADGQRWILPLAEVTFRGENVLTRFSPASRPLKLDRLRRIVADNAAVESPLTKPPTADTAVLRSGDHVSGFVAGIDTTADNGAFTVKLERGGRTSDLPSPSLRTLALTTAAQSTSTVSTWLADGQRLVADASLTGAEWTLRHPGTPDQPLKLGLGAVRAVLLAPGRFVPLTSLPRAEPDKSSTSEPPFLGPEQPLGLQDLFIPGPQAIAWTLPASASGLSATLALREDCCAWGNCGVTLALRRADRDVTLFTGSLTGERPTLNIAVELPVGTTAPTLILTIDAGEHGPIQDRVVLRRAIVKVGK